MPRIITWCAASCALALVGCMGEPTSGDARPPAEPLVDSVANSGEFTVWLDDRASSAAVIQKILDAGHGEIAGACEGVPDAKVRIADPFDPSNAVDVPCSTVLDGAAEAASILTSDGPLGEAQQAWSPIGVGCTVAVGAAGLIASFAVCPHARNPRNKKLCEYWSGGGFFGLGVMCAFM
jgi:hypothetical protein